MSKNKTSSGAKPFLKKLFFLLFLSSLIFSPIEARSVSFEIRIGERALDWCKRLQRRGLWSCRELKKASKRSGTINLRRYPFLGKAALGLRRLEGALRPGRYTFRKNTSPEKLLKVLLDKAKAAYRGLENPNIPMRHSLRDELILASIVEKEAVANRGYRRIARVFWNRLKQKQPLGSCPTVEYALGYHRPFLLFKDLKLRSPYNVYIYKGLPPTPIAFFSKEALDAVRRPSDSKEHRFDFFFVFDWTSKKLYFAQDYETHKRNAARARKNFIQKYGKKMMHQIFPNKFYEPIE